MSRPAYPSPTGTATFKLDEGFSEDTRSQDETGNGVSTTGANGFEEWVMAQSEQARAGMTVSAHSDGAAMRSTASYHNLAVSCVVRAD